MGHCFYQSWLQLPYHLFKNCLVTSSFRENGCSVLNWCKGIECKLELSRTERIWATAFRRGNNPRSMLSKVPSHNWFCGRDLYFSFLLRLLVGGGGQWMEGVGWNSGHSSPYPLTPLIRLILPLTTLERERMEIFQWKMSDWTRKGWM